MDTFDEAVEGHAQGAEFIVAVDDQALGQVAFTLGDVVHGTAHQVQRLHQHADQHAQQGDDDDHGDHRGDDRRGAELAEHGERGVLVEHQGDVPVHRGHAADVGEGDELLLAVHLDFLEPGTDFRCAARVGVREVFQDQLAVRMNQDLAVGADDERMPVTAEVQRVDDGADAAQVDVRTGHADKLALMLYRGGEGDHQLAGGGGNVGFGDDGLLRGGSGFIPAA